MSFGWAWLSSVLGGDVGSVLFKTGTTSFSGSENFTYDTGSELLSLTSSMDVKGQIRAVPSNLVYSSSVEVDCSLSNNFFLTMEGSASLSNPTNMKNGSVYNFIIKQDSTGTRLLTYGSKYKFPGGTAPILSTATGSVDIMSCVYDNTEDALYCSLTNDYK